MFPPVFGHRLQAKVAKCGERVLMDIEVSGTPSPIVTWYKDDKPLYEANVSTHKITSSGNSHTLIIEKGTFCLFANIYRKKSNIGIIFLHSIMFDS